MGRRVLVIGAARSGLAAVDFLCKHHCDVILTDMKPPADALVLEHLANLQVRTIWGEQPDVQKLAPQLVVISPGIALTIAPAVTAKALGIPIVNETELAFRSSKAIFAAITGTNGKTTTTTLLGELLKNGRRQVVVGGNIGIPLVSVAEDLQADDLIVAEMSSFQLETTQTFKPKVAIMLNLTPDHLDRHGDMQGYLAAKAKIFANQDEKDYLILNADDAYLAPLAQQTRSHVIFFSQKHILKEGVYLRDDSVFFAYGGQEMYICERKEIAIKGAHNLENAMAAIAAAMLLGAEVKDIRQVLRDFMGVEHRLEVVRRWHDVLFINDSKGTNPDSTIKALKAYDEPIILIAGGKNKGSDFQALAAVIAQKVKQVILLGQAKKELEQALKAQNYQQYVLVETYEEAVALASAIAVAGDIVLLSPACASWDMFANYEERGKLFKKLVNELKE